MPGYNPSPAAPFNGMFGGFPSMYGSQMPSNAFDMWQNFGQHGGMSPSFYHQPPAPHHAPSAMAAASAPGNETPDNTEGEQKIWGMTPLVFGGMPANAASMHQVHAAQFPAQYPVPAVRNVMHQDGQIYQVTSQGDRYQNAAAPAPMQMQMPQMLVPNGLIFPHGTSGIPLQEPKKWVRWSEQEDQHLRRAVQAYGEQNFKMISERIFHGARSEVQCKNRWKKVRLHRIAILFDCITSISNDDNHRHFNPVL